ncbi:hypothetical protein [uncultured Amnibacterium sp.]|uniref:hypothetical protein n=1 Tax=uncultured Amnibacterium sp. TaxID=1631851 RepID=UPI0035C94394
MNRSATQWDELFGSGEVADRDFESFGQDLVEAALRDDPSELIGFIHLAAEFARGNLEGFALSIIGLGTARWRGDLKGFDDANVSVEGVRRTLTQNDVDPSQLKAELLFSLAELERARSERDQALDALRRAVEIFLALDEHLRVADSLKLAAIIAFEKKDLGEADRLSAHARDLYAAHGQTEDALGVALNRLQYAYSSGEPGILRSRLDELSDINLPAYGAAVMARFEALWQTTEPGSSEAREYFRRALRLADLSYDEELRILIRRDLGTFYANRGQRRWARHWWQRAREMAQSARLQEDEAEVLRSFAFLAVEEDNLEQAEQLFGEASELSARSGDTAGALHDRADALAALLGAELQRAGATSAEEVRAEFDTKVISPLLGTLDLLEARRDVVWAARIVRNLQVAWIFKEAQGEGAALLGERANGAAAALEPEYRKALLRGAGLLLIQDEQASQGVARLEESAQLEEDDAQFIAEDLWQLALEVDGRLGRPREAMALADRAIDLFAETRALTSLGNALNDSALMAERAMDPVNARSRLERARVLAEEQSDRVLGALVVFNLAHLDRREGRIAEARRGFSDAAQMSLSVGIREQAIECEIELGICDLIEEKDLKGAYEIGSNAEKSAIELRDDRLVGDALSLQASVNFAQGEFGRAADLWRRSMAADATADPGEREAFILEALARIPEYKRFDRELSRAVRRAQRTDTRDGLVGNLWRPALTWLRAGRIKRAAEVLAVAALLGAEAWGQRRRSYSAANYAALSRAGMQSLAEGLAGLFAVQLIDEFSDETRTELLAETSRQIERIAGSDVSASLLRFLSDDTAE